MKIKIILSLLVAVAVVFFLRDFIAKPQLEKVKATVRILPGSEMNNFQSMVSQAKDMTGYVVMEAVAERLQLLDPAMKGADLEKTIESLQNQIMVEVKADSDLVDIYPRDPETDGAADLINITVQEYLRLELSEREVFYEHRINQLEGKRKRVFNRVNQLDMDIHGAEGQAQRRDQNEVDFLKAEIENLRAEQARLLEIYTPKHPDVFKAAEQMREYQEKLDALPPEDLLWEKRKELAEAEKELIHLMDQMREVQLKRAQTTANVQVIRFARPLKTKWDFLTVLKICLFYTAVCVLFIASLSLIERLVQAGFPFKKED